MNHKSLFIILLLLITLAASLFLIFRPVVFFGRASTPRTADNLQNSYLFASPITAKADGKELIRVSVFILDSQGLGAANIPVSLKTDPSINILAIQPQTDSYGKAIFDLSSSTTNTYSITALVNGSILPQTVDVIFY